MHKDKPRGFLMMGTGTAAQRLSPNDVMNPTTGALRLPSDDWDTWVLTIADTWAPVTVVEALSATNTVLATRAPHPFQTGDAITVQGIANAAWTARNGDNTATRQSSTVLHLGATTAGADVADFLAGSTGVTISHKKTMAAAVAADDGGTGSGPVTVTTEAAHGLQDDDVVVITGSGGNPLAGTFTIDVASATTFTLRGQTMTAGAMGIARVYSAEEKPGGTICKQFNRYEATESDFIALSDSQRRDMTIGTLHVTQRADVGVEFVVEPKSSTSLEVTGLGLDHMLDRVAVVDCQGACGSSSPAAAVTAPKEWTQFSALSPFVDRPSNNEETADPPVDAPDGATSYRLFAGSYCAGQNVAVPTHESALVRNHQCFRKCFQQTPCEDANCFCDGHMQGYDDDDSDALCLNQEQCEALCTTLRLDAIGTDKPGCSGVDMHATLNRCYLNVDTDGVCPARAEAVGTSAEQLTPHMAYNFLLAQQSGAGGIEQRRLQSAGEVRSLLAAADPGLSWSRILRFSDITFTTGGTYKLCFCDSSLLRTGTTAHYYTADEMAVSGTQFCSQPSHFTIEIGTVHASGIQCLLGDRRFQRGTCEAQTHGGLRCYGAGATVPRVVVPDAYLGVPRPGQDLSESAVVAAVRTFCRYGPADEVASVDFCQGV
mmetsp:Transcript_15923/g.34666  ORF Transcript_15923/g.34666 Transcript_15923/m.34666 type:complete len:658 (-) Transcript_15923:7-1980(-)